MVLENKIKTLSLCSIVLAVLLIIFLVFPLLENIRKSSQELVSQKENLAVLENKITNLEKFKIIYQDLGLFLKQIDNLFVNAEVPIEFISFLEEKAKESKIDIDISLGQSGKAGKDSWSSLSFQISSVGSFPNFLSFLERIENSAYLVEIQNLNISHTGKGEFSTNEVKANFLIKVYTQ